MPTWTVISTVSAGDGDPIAAVPCRADVFGHGVHTATVQASTADDALTAVRDAFRIAGHFRPNADEFEPSAARWTVIGTATNGACASHSVIAVIAGQHTVEGRYKSMLSHRWVRVVDASDVHAAEAAGYKAAAEVYDESWD